MVCGELLKKYNLLNGQMSSRKREKQQTSSLPSVESGTVWPEVYWYLLEAKRKEKGMVDLVSVFRCHVMTEYSDFTHIYTDGAKQPETGVTGFGVAVPAKVTGITRRTSNVCWLR